MSLAVAGLLAPVTGRAQGVPPTTLPTVRTTGTPRRLALDEAVRIAELQSETIRIARALNRAGANVSFVEIPSDKGHDAFLLDEPDFHRTLAGFLAGCAVHAGLVG